MRRRRSLLLALLPLAVLLALLFLRRSSQPLPAPARAASPAGAEAAPAREPPPSRLPLRLLPPGGAGPVRPGPARFEGRVLSRGSGRGVAGAEITFARGGAADSVRAGPDGSFRFEPGVPGRWLLAAVTAPGHLPFAPEWGQSPVQLVAEPGRAVTGIEIHLAPAVELAGQVRTAAGTPAPGAEVRLLGTGGEAALVGLPDRFTSGVDGTFRAAAPEGALLEARLPGHAPGRAEVTSLVLLEGRLTITLGPRVEAAPPARAAIRGRVVERGGGGVPGALVLATRGRATGPGAIAAAQSSTAADGRFTLSDLAEGPYRLVARAAGRAPASVRAEAGAPEEVTIEVDDGGRLRGCVRDAASGAPVPLFTVLVFSRRNALWVEPERSLSVIDPGGCYLLDDLRPGPAVVVFSAPSRAPSGELAVEVPAPPGEAVLDGALEAGGTLAGTVRDDATAAPLGGARLRVEGALLAAASTFPVLAEAATGPDGAFTLTGLPRRFSIQATAAGHHARVVGGLGFEPGRSAGPLDIRLRPLVGDEEPGTDLAGIGAALAAREEGLVVMQVVPGGGAAEVGLAPGDVIVEVDGRPVAELGFAGSIDAIRGPEGTFVVLRVRRGAAAEDLRVPRRLVRG